MNLADVVLPELPPSQLRRFWHGTWGEAFVAPVAPKLPGADEIHDAIAKATEARIDMWAALYDLSRLAERDGHSVVVTHRAGTIDDAWVDRHTDDPGRIYLIAVATLDDLPIVRPAWEGLWSWES